MSIASLNNIETELLEKIQEGMPLVLRPFKEIAEQLDISESHLLETLKELKAKQIIRRISPIYITKMMNYDSSLIAFKVKPDQIEAAAEIINGHPGVSHNYQRNHDFNLWFTLAVPPDSKFGLDQTVELLAQQIQPLGKAILRSTKVFKIGVKLKLKASENRKDKVDKDKEKSYQPLSELEKSVIRLSQADLELVSEPFAKAIESLDINENEFIELLQSFKERKIMRRFAALLHHRKAGFSANGMSVWQVPSERIDEVGYKLAAFKSVSHCYERSTSENWTHNVFAMIHGTSPEEVDQIIAEMETEVNLKHTALLYSTREFKKKRLTYFTPDYAQWEANQGD